MPGQPQLGTSTYAIGLDIVGGLNVTAGATPSVLVIQSNQQFALNLKVDFGGTLAAALVQNMTYSAQFYYESLGPGPDGTLAPPANGPTSGAVLNGAVWELPITTTPTTPATQGMSPTAPGQPPRLYNLSAVVTFALGSSTVPINCFIEGPIIEVTA